MIKLKLYTTAGCHLCELASNLLLEINNHTPISITAVEIGDDDELVERYGTIIPVIEFADGNQLNWPFDQDDVTTKISSLA